MQVVFAPRASAILYSLLEGLLDRRPWLLPANICPIVPITFLKAGIGFEFVDISLETLHLDLRRAEMLVNSQQGRYGGILFAHTYGDPSTPSDFFKAIKNVDRRMRIIDDRCLCIPDLSRDPVSPADITLYSTGYGKIVDLGFGGYAFLNEEVRYEASHLTFKKSDYRILERNYKEAVRRRDRFIYVNNDWLETDTGLPLWSDYCRSIEDGLKVSLAQRCALNEAYRASLPPEIQLPSAYQTWRFNVRLKEKQRTLKAIFDAGLFASSHYASLAGIMNEGQCPVAEELERQVLNLFNDHHFSLEQAKRTSTIILENLVTSER